MPTPTVLIKDDWWDTQYRKIVNEADAVASLLGLNPTASEVAEYTPATEIVRLTEDLI